MSTGGVGGGSDERGSAMGGVCEMRWVATMGGLRRAPQCNICRECRIVQAGVRNAPCNGTAV